MTDRDLAPTILTPTQYAAWELADRGASQRTIALKLGISRSAVRARLEEARRKIRLAKETAA